MLLVGVGSYKKVGCPIKSVSAAHCWLMWWPNGILYPILSQVPPSIPAIRVLHHKEKALIIDLLSNCKYILRFKLHLNCHALWQQCARETKLVLAIRDHMSSSWNLLSLQASCVFCHHQAELSTHQGSIWYHETDQNMWCQGCFWFLPECSQLYFEIVTFCCQGTHCLPREFAWLTVPVVRTRICTKRIQVYLDRVPAWLWEVFQKQVGWGTWLVKLHSV